MLYGLWFNAQRYNDGFQVPRLIGLFETVNEARRHKFYLCHPDRGQHRVIHDAKLSIIPVTPGEPVLEVVDGLYTTSATGTHDPLIVPNWVKTSGILYDRYSTTMYLGGMPAHPVLWVEDNNVFLSCRHEHVIIRKDADTIVFDDILAAEELLLNIKQS